MGVEVGGYSILCYFKNCEDGFVLHFMGWMVSLGKDREGLWEELGVIKGLWNDLWCIVGDFNIVIKITYNAPRVIPQPMEYLGCFLFSVKETLLGWRGSFVGKKRKKVWQVGPLCLFWVIWKARNKIAFENNVLSIYRLKASFVYLLWLETKLWMKDGPSTLIDFVDWVGSRWGRRFFVFPCFGSNCKGVSVSLLYFCRLLF